MYLSHLMKKYTCMSSPKSLLLHLWQLVMVSYQSLLLQVICQELEQLIGEDDARKCKPFIQKCVQYCWYLSVQDPGMYLAVWTSGTKFDNNEMKSFTKIGQYVDFTVWPALYLHRDGPLLSKAIVQGTNHATV